MPVTDDPRLYIGASVEAKARMFVTSLAECSRRYGTNAKTKVVPGLVVSFGQDRAPPGRSRATTFIVADFFFGDNEVKRGKLNIGCQMLCTSRRVEGNSPTT
ncbi:Transposase IS4 [Fragilaria crotonensis]|nr:Transposase IS4 [Fragilaria crotonensis]